MNVLIKLRSEMKAYSLLILGLFLVLAQVACKKNLLQLATVSTSLNPTIQNEAEVSLGSIVTIVGNITNDGGAPVFERGICYTSFQTNDVKSHSDPTINNSVLKDTGIGSGSFVMTMNPSNANATYVIRAYARTKAGVAYGKALTLRTAAIEEKIKKIVIEQPTIEVVSKISQRDILRNPRVCFDAKITNDGGSELTSMNISVYEIKRSPAFTKTRVYINRYDAQNNEVPVVLKNYEMNLAFVNPPLSIKYNQDYLVEVVVYNKAGARAEVEKYLTTAKDDGFRQKN